VHRRAGVEVEDEPDPVAEAQRVDGRSAPARVDEPRVLGGARPRARRGSRRHAGGVELLGHPGAEVGRQALPLHGEHPVALQVAERAVVGDDLEAVAQRLEAAPGPVAAVRAVADEVAQQRGALVGRQRGDADARVLLGHRAGLEEQRGEQRLLVAVDVQQPHGRPSPDAAGPGPGARPSGRPRRPAGAQVLDPRAAAVGALDARDEARHDRP
jgi:hypothetical protein